MALDQDILHVYGCLSPKAKAILPKIVSCTSHHFKVRERAGYFLVILEGGSLGERNEDEREKLKAAIHELEAGGLIKREARERFNVTDLGLRVADILR